MEATTMKKANHGANARRWREWRGINQDVLAEQIGVSQTTLCNYEKKEKLDPEVLDKIAKALDIPVEAITEVTNENPINIFSGTWNDNAFASGTVHNPTFNPIDKVVELYERMLEEKNSVIELLKEVLKDKDKK